MNLDMLFEPGPGDADGARVHGVVVGVVADNNDPLNLGRVRLKLPWLSDDDVSDWARVMSPMAGKGRGLFLLPEVDDEVLVMFQLGDVSYPYVLGSLWSAVDEPPPEANEGQPARAEDGAGGAPTARTVDRRVLRSKAGHTVVLDDTGGAEKISIVDKSGKNRIEIDSTKNTVTIESEGELALVTKGNLELRSGADVKVRCQSLSIDAEQGYDLQASQGRIAASGSLDLECRKGVRINDDGLVVT